MNNESHGNKVQELLNNLIETQSWFNDIFPNEDDVRRMEAIDKAIEAIRVLQLIAKDGHFTEAERAQKYLESL